MRKQLRWVSIFACVSLVSCAPSLDELHLRDADTSTLPANYGAAQPASDEKPPELSGWQDFFDGDALRSTIDVALKKNQELAILEQEVLVAQNEVGAREGEYLPKLGLGAKAGIDKVGKETSQGAADAANGVKEDLPNFSLGLFMSWEIDIWKKLRNATKAALFHYMASVDGRNFLVTRLVAEVSQTYYELLALHKMVDILEENITLQTQALEIMRLEKQAARVTELAVKRFEAEVLKNQSRRYTLKQQIVEKENQLNFLSGRYPQTIVTAGEDFLKLEPKALVAGVPSKLLENRPDVRQAELELKASMLSEG